MKNSTIFFETKVSDYINSMEPGKRYSFFLDDTTPYSFLTKRGTIKADAKKHVVINEYSDEYGAIIVIVKKYSTITALEKEFVFCLDHNGKMAHIGSCSTSVELNARCAARAKDPDSICHFCYAKSMAAQYADLSKKLARNTALYCSDILPMHKLPLIDPAIYPFFRFESFGDISNTIQVINYINIARINPAINFAWWTKNPDIIAAALDKYNDTIPANINIIYSSPRVNDQVDADTLKKRYPFITAIFTVYNAAYAIEHNIDINCGARDCFKCNLCYRTHGKNDIVIVNEIVKNEQSTYYKSIA